jgi:murein L,D-transpeptidase YcbB/YkuD
MMVAGLCQQYAIDLQMLDTALAQRFGVSTQGVNPQALSAQPQQFRDPRVDQYLAMQAMQQQQAAERETAELQSQTAAFAEQHEFFFDVRDDMADMIEIAARRGIVLPVKEAYEKACALNPDVSKILAQRNGTNNPRAMTQAALRARRAASSVKGEPSPHGQTAPQNESLRGAIEAAFEQAGSSRL